MVVSPDPGGMIETSSVLPVWPLMVVDGVVDGWSEGWNCIRVGIRPGDVSSWHPWEWKRIEGLLECWLFSRNILDEVKHALVDPNRSWELVWTRWSEQHPPTWKQNMTTTSACSYSRSCFWHMNMRMVGLPLPPQNMSSTTRTEAPGKNVRRTRPNNKGIETMSFRICARVWMGGWSRHFNQHTGQQVKILFRCKATRF